MNSWEKCSSKAGTECHENRKGMFVQAPSYPLTRAKEDVTSRTAGRRQDLPSVTPLATLVSSSRPPARTTPNLDRLVPDIQGYCSPARRPSATTTQRLSTPEMLPPSNKVHEFVKHRYDDGRISEEAFKLFVKDKENHNRISMYHAKVEFLRPLVEASGKTELKSEILVLEYLVAVGIIFIETFQNTGHKVTLDNIDTIEKEMIRALGFFSRWHESVKAEMEKDEMIFLSKITYANLRTGVFGFLQYCRYVLSVDGGPKYVPFGHSNTSVLEMLFSTMRSFHNDTPESYTSGLGAVTFAHGITALDNNKMYTPDQVGHVETRDTLKALTKRRDRERTKIVDMWSKNLADRKEDKDERMYLPLERTAINGVTERLLAKVKTLARGKGVLFCLVCEDKGFREYMFANAFGPSKEWFRTLCCGLTKEEEAQFECASYGIMDDLFGLWESSIFAGSRSCDSKYHYQLLRYLQEQDDEHPCLRNRMRTMPPVLQQRGGIIVMTLVFSRWLLGWIRKAMLLISQDLNPKKEENQESSVEDEKREVNRFLGWAIFHLRRKLVQRRDRAIAKNWHSTEDVPGMISTLDSMRIFHNEAVTDEEYMRDCYSDFDLTDNDGWLSLVAKPFFSFGKELLSRIRSEINIKAIKRLGNEAIKTAINRIKATESFASLSSKFLDAVSASSLKHATKVSLLERIIKKAFHARAKVASVAYRASHTDRHVTGASTQAFRQSLMAKTEKTTKEKAKRILGDGGRKSAKKQRK